MTGQVASWLWWPPTTHDFTTNSKTYVPTNDTVVQPKLYDNTLFRCDFMLDAQTHTRNAIYAALTVDGVRQRIQALPGDNGILTFGFSSLLGTLPAGNYQMGIAVAIPDGSSVTFETSETAITCYELALPPEDAKASSNVIAGVDPVQDASFALANLSSPASPTVLAAPNSAPTAEPASLLLLSVGLLGLSAVMRRRRRAD
jgi:hypothetical protein